MRNILYTGGLRLTTTLSVTIQTYDGPEQVVVTFCHVR